MDRIAPDIAIEVQEAQELSMSPSADIMLNVSRLFEVASNVISARLSATIK
jgi:hypothetical protein